MREAPCAKRYDYARSALPEACPPGNNSTRVPLRHAYLIAFGGGGYVSEKNDFFFCKKMAYGYIEIYLFRKIMYRKNDSNNNNNNSTIVFYCIVLDSNRKKIIFGGGLKPPELGDYVL